MGGDDGGCAGGLIASVAAGASLPGHDPKTPLVFPIRRQMYEFLGCDFSTRYLRYEPQDDPYPDRWSWVPEAGGRIDPSHAFKWNERLDPAVIARFTAMASSFMDHHGYDR